MSDDTSGTLLQISQSPRNIEVVDCDQPFLDVCTSTHFHRRTEQNTDFSAADFIQKIGLLLFGLVSSISLDTFYTNKNYVASEFIEKAILFYIGYLSQQDNLNYISPMITETVKAQINGTEQRLARLLFKVAVELGKLTHLLAVAKDVDDETLRQLIVMCINEVRKINGAIDCEDAVRYQKE